MKYEIKPSAQFQRDLKRAEKRRYNLSLLKEVIRSLAKDEILPTKYRDHALSGTYVGCRECHITPDWLLVYRKDEDFLYLYLTRTGTHSDLF